jgi:hypothetical protein
MIAAFLTQPTLSNLHELCALCVKNHAQPRPALSHSFTSPAPASRQGLGVPAHPQDLAQPFSAQALTSYFAHTPGVGILPRASLASNGFRANSLRIRTSGKHTGNPTGMSSSKTKHLKLLRMNTYKKTGGGAPTPSNHSTVLENPPAGYNSAQPLQELASTPPASSTLPVAQGFAEQGTTSAIVEGAKLRKRKDAPRGVPGGRCDESRKF